MVRPTPDRVRETLFNWLSPYIAGARVLDAFAGSWALGIEALSRVAAHTVLLDRDPQCIAAIRAQLRQWQIDETRFSAERVDALSWLAKGRSVDIPSFNIVFLDPPFDQGLWQASIAALERGCWLAPQAFVYLEVPARSRDALPLALPPFWEHWRESTAGEVGYHLYKYNKAEGTGA